MINILIRLHTNLEKFYKTLDSIRRQNYYNTNILVSVDDKNIYEDIISKDTGCQYVYIDSTNLYAGEPSLEIDNNCKHNNKQIFGQLFLPNIYFNILHQYIKPGYIFYLDVGDILLDSDMFTYLEQYKQLKYNIIWKTVAKNSKIIPSEWHDQPILCDIDSSSIMFPSEYIHNWTGYRRGDFRVIREICKKNKNIFIPKIYVKKD